ncbi:MAG: hypothetical protein JSW08_03025 [archaeon]|nr:MAG: hypothetical protein JSW08_03025 [archaeon]
MFSKKKKKNLVPEPPDYGPEDFGVDVIQPKVEELKQVKDSAAQSLGPTPDMFRQRSFKDAFKHSPEKPVFIKVENFKQIVETIIGVEKKLDELEQIISKLQDLKQAEEEKMNTWQTEIQDIKDKLNILEENFSEKV